MFRTIPAFFAFFVLLSVAQSHADNRADALRHDSSLAEDWKTAFDEADSKKFTGFEQPNFDDSNWREISIPHNWDTYQGYRQLRHGNLHGTAWYRRAFSVAPSERDRRIFLFFEGVGSYATVWVNGKQVGQHAGGLTTFTLDITEAVLFDHENILAVQAEHPAGIRDLPWVCGGCERASGFSEGPQPLGIFRPVHLVTTAPIRVEPFGVHVWIDGPQSSSVQTRVQTELRNYGSSAGEVTLLTRLVDRDGKSLAEIRSSQSLAVGKSTTLDQTLPVVSAPHLWSPADPYLDSVVSELLINGIIIDRVETPFGVRWVTWPKTENPDRRRLLVNGRPFFINGTADYEHQLGANFAFSDTQIDARVHQIEAAGFNAFRDAHHPHNLRFQQHWDRDGLLWWSQFGAHIWFDTDAFRANYKILLRDWVKERRNSPSLILWGLQNESLLPTDFAQECSAIIREMDPTASTQRLITTCNGGTGTDWDVPQNWSGTYSGDPEKYDDDLRTQSLNGEYGAWRSLDLHAEGGFDSKGPLSEDRLCALMETKIRLAEKARADACGQFQWPFTSHANPGRNFGDQGEQLFEGIRPLDRIGPVNNKGLFTIWGEPTDGFYLFRANYAPKETQPMVYIVSHTWPDRWTTPGKKSGLIVYSNCDDVELFNGLRSLGRHTQAGRGTHFQWDEVEIDCNLLRAEAHVAGKLVATDTIRLHHLPEPKNAPSKPASLDLTAPIPGQHYLYRINCGGPDYTDSHHNNWLADRELTPGDSWGSSSWAADYENLPPAFGSQRKIYDPIFGTSDEPLYQSFRYGHGDLSYWFTLPNGDYEVELFFIEPWYGVGGGLNCSGWRVFDVNINDQTVIKDLDLWQQAGRAPVKKVISAHVQEGVLMISFPRVTAGQSVVSAIAISSKTNLPAPKPPASTFTLTDARAGFVPATHLDTGDRQYSDREGGFTKLPYELLNADWIRTSSSTAAITNISPLQFELNADAEAWIAHDDRITPKPIWLTGWERTTLPLSSNAAGDAKFILYRKLFAKDSIVTLGANGQGGSMYTVFVTRTLPPSAPQFAVLPPDSENWNAIGHIEPGVRLGALDRTLTRFPSNLADGDLLVPVTENAQNAGLRFTVNDHVEVVGAFPISSSSAGDWIATKQFATTNDGVSYVLRRLRFPASAAANFAPDSTPCFAFVRAVRPSATYSPETLADGSFEWTIHVGVGDRYGLNFKYRNPDSASTVTATLEIVQANGSLLRTDLIEFPSTGDTTNWSVVRTRTGESINAGTYKFHLKIPGSSRLQLNTLEIE